MDSSGRCSIRKYFRFVFPFLGGVNGQMARRHGDGHVGHLKVSTAVVGGIGLDFILKAYKKKQRIREHFSVWFKRSSKMSLNSF